MGALPSSSWANNQGKKARQGRGEQSRRRFRQKSEARQKSFDVTERTEERSEVESEVKWKKNKREREKGVGRSIYYYV